MHPSSTCLHVKHSRPVPCSDWRSSRRTKRLSVQVTWPTAHRLPSWSASAHFTASPATTIMNRTRRRRSAHTSFREETVRSVPAGSTTTSSSPDPATASTLPALRVWLPFRYVRSTQYLAGIGLIKLLTNHPHPLRRLARRFGMETQTRQLLVA